MAHSISTHHNLPDVNDEGRIKRYGFMIVMAAIILVLAMFVTWAYRSGWENQREIQNVGSSGVK